MTRRPCTSSYVDRHGISSLTPCCLVAQDKCHSGAWPIGIRETLRCQLSYRALGMGTVYRNSVTVCQPGGSLHGNGLYHDVHLWGQCSGAVILVDASDAFNSANGKATLRNTHTLWDEWRKEIHEKLKLSMMKQITVCEVKSTCAFLKSGEHSQTAFNDTQYKATFTCSPQIWPFPDNYH